MRLAPVALALLVGAFLLAGSARAQRPPPASRPLVGWITGSVMGDGGLGAAYQGDVGLVLPRRFVVAGVYNRQGEFFDDADWKQSRTAALLAGRQFGGRAYELDLAAGPLVAWGVDHVGWKENELVDGFLGRQCPACTERRFRTAGALVRADVGLRIGRMDRGHAWGALLLTVQAHTTPARSYTSVGLGFRGGRF